MTHDPLADALAEISQGNVTSGLDFLLQKTLDANDPSQCYAPALIRAAAAAPGSQSRDAAAKLKAKYKKDFSLPRFNADVKEVKAELTRAAPSTRLLTSESGAIKPLLANAIIQLDTVLDLAFDTFSSIPTLQKPSPWGTDGRWRDRDDMAAANYLQHAGIAVGPTTAHDAALHLAYQSPFHPVRDWLTSLKWDGEPRLEQLAAFYFGCPNDEYTRQVSAFWMTSAVARIMRPGCIAKYMIVLEGAQNESKSKALRALTNGHLKGDGGIQWFRDNMPELDHKDLGQYMQGVWVIEVAELSAIRGKEWERTKAFISSPRDTFRAPYGRNMEDYPRQCVFAGTTNERQWGGDLTGLTRFWPLSPGVMRIDDLLRDREQLWAEARVLFDEGRPWYGDTKFDQLAKGEQDKRAPEDALGDRIAATCEALLLGMLSDEESVSVREILDSWDTPQRDRAGLACSVGRALTRLGWTQFQPRDTPNRVRRYKKPS